MPLPQINDDRDTPVTDLQLERWADATWPDANTPEAAVARVAIRLATEVRRLRNNTPA